MIIRRINKKKKVIISFRVNEETKKDFESVEKKLQANGYAIDADEMIIRFVKSIKRSEPGTRRTECAVGSEAGK